MSKTWRNCPKSDRPSFKWCEVLEDTNESYLMDKASILRFIPCGLSLQQPKEQKREGLLEAQNAWLQPLMFFGTLLLLWCYPIFPSFALSFLGEACQVSRCHWSLGMRLKFLAFSICVRIAILFKATSEFARFNWRWMRWMIHSSPTSKHFWHVS